MGRYDDLMSLSLRKGFFIPAAEVYGGLAGFYDYGHNGARLKRKWEDLWLEFFLGLGENYHLIDTSTVLPYSALKASGHVDLFSDILVYCTKCKEAHRADQLIEAATGTSGEGLELAQVKKAIEENNIQCVRCGGPLGEPVPFNIMFPMAVGPRGEDKAFLRPETAQGAYLSFKREFEILRKRLPLGLAMVGNVYRNEISPRQGTYRMREFHQAELQIFFDSEDFEGHLNLEEVEDVRLRLVRAEDRERILDSTVKEVIDDGVPPFYAYHLAKVQEFYLDALRVSREAFRLYELNEAERAFYNRVHFDVQVRMDSLGGFREVGGVHYRTDYDLMRHQEHSRQRMQVFHQGKRFIPHVLELSFGIDRNIWALLDLGYEMGEKTVLHLPPRLAPFTCAVLPLVNKGGLPEMAREVYAEVRGSFDALYDDSGSIGRRYARMDEIGTPYCLTVDYESLERRDVTVRDRETTLQVRVATKELWSVLRALTSGATHFEELRVGG
ncbi:MAG: glycine--tRNA ligase [Thermoplasmata archaeon]